VSDQATRIAQRLDLVPERWKAPPAESVAGITLLEVGLLCVLARHLSAPQADRTAKALAAAYPDWNDLRVSQIQEFEAHIRTKNVQLRQQVARDVKAYLQDVFQKNHGYDLEFLREDLGEAGKFVLQLTELGASAGHYLLLVASGGEVPVTAGVVRVLDRLGLLRRTSSIRRVQEVLEPIIPPDQRASFAIRVGQVIESYCDAKKPLCWECVLVRACPFGKKIEVKWRARKKRQEEQERREEQQRRKAEERLRKKAEAEAKRRAKVLAREEAKRQRDEAKRRQAEERRAQQEAKRREAERKKKEAVKAAAKKKAKRPTTKKGTSKKPKTSGSKKKSEPATKRTKTGAAKKPKTGGAKPKTGRKKTGRKRPTTRSRG